MPIDLIICLVLAGISFVLGRYIGKEELKKKLYLVLYETKLRYFLLCILSILMVSLFFGYPTTWCLAWLFFIKVVDRSLYLYRQHQLKQ